MDKLTKKGLDGTQLKTIALALMVLDHIHYYFEYTGCIGAGILYDLRQSLPARG